MKKNAIRPTTVLVCLAVALPLLAAEKLGAKVGQWETTTTMNLGGAGAPAMPAITLPPEMLANLPPAQRAQVEKAMGALSGKPVTAKSCVTEKDLADGAFQQQAGDDMKCTYKTVSSTAKRQEATFQCTSPAGPAEGKLTVDLVNADHVKGVMQIKTPMASIESKFDAKWLGACPAAK